MLLSCVVVAPSVVASNVVVPTVVTCVVAFVVPAADVDIAVS